MESVPPCDKRCGAKNTTDCNTSDVGHWFAMTFLGSAVHVGRRALLASLTMNFCRDRTDLDTLLIFIIFYNGYLTRKVKGIKLLAVK